MHLLRGCGAPGRGHAPRRGSAGAALVKLQSDDGYRGIWYYNQPTKDEYFTDQKGGRVWRLPATMEEDFAKPEVVR